MATRPDQRSVFRSRIHLPDCGWQEHEHAAPDELIPLLDCIRSCVHMGASLSTLSVTLGPYDISQQIRHLYLQQMGFTSSPTGRIQSPAEENKI